MLPAVLLAIFIAAAQSNKPPVIQNDLLNEVSWSANHDYEVHDHDALQENRPDDGKRYFPILVPTVAQEVGQDRQSQQSLDRGNNQVSVESNGASGLVTPILEHNPISAPNEEEILHHGDFVKTQPKPQTTQNAGISDESVGFDSKYISDIPLGRLSEEIQKSDKNDKVEEEISFDENDKEMVDGDIIYVELKEDDPLDDADTAIQESNHSQSKEANENINEDSNPVTKIVLSDQDQGNGKSKIPEPPFIHNTSPKNINLPSNEPLSEKEMSFITTTQTIVLKNKIAEHQEQPSTTTAASTPLIKVHLLTENGDVEEEKDPFIAPQYLQRNKGKSLNDSPITHISKVSSKSNPPVLVKDIISKSGGRRILIDVKKNAATKPKSVDSVVSSTTERLTTAEVEDKLESDLQQSAQEDIINSDPSGALDSLQEKLPLYDPPELEGIPVIPVPLPYPGIYPSKTNQPVLHHIIHALLSPPYPDDEAFSEEPILHRYSPNFVPYPVYLAIPY